MSTGIALLFIVFLFTWLVDTWREENK